MAISEKPWNGDASRFDDASAYCASCLIDENEPGAEKVKSKCHLPVKEPGGTVSRHGVHAAAAALAGARGGVGASAESKKAAARKLVRLYGELKDPVPDSIKNMAM